MRESAARLVRHAKEHAVSVLLVGHVTKDGALAGPRVLEHMVDTVLYFESEADRRFRVIRAVKNRFGAANEIGLFAMTEKGLREVRNPSAIFLARGAGNVAGSVVTVVREGTRPLLVELQALVDEASGPPRRLTVGIDQSRLNMLLAVLHRHAGVSTQGLDVYVNVVGGVRIAETSADLAILAAVRSTLNTRPVDRALVVYGEVGLAGEIRPVPGGEERVREAAKHGFARALVPAANVPRRYPRRDRGRRRRARRARAGADLNAGHGMAPHERNSRGMVRAKRSRAFRIRRGGVPVPAAGPQQAGACATILRSEGMTRTVRTALPAVWTISIG